MPRNLKVLSLDLDWFNSAGNLKDRKEKIESFFDEVSLHCILPSEVVILKEHQYLYPWCKDMLRLRMKSKIDIVNIDEHHDFYYLEDIRRYPSTPIDCGNFFAFMTYDNMVSSYAWVTNSNQGYAGRRDIITEMNSSHSFRVRQLADRVKVYGMNGVWRAIRGKRFDAFAIIQSPGYTLHSPVTCAAVDKIVNSKFKVRRNKCSKELNYNHMPDMSALVPMVI